MLRACKTLTFGFGSNGTRLNVAARTIATASNNKFETLIYDVKDRICRITLNRPDRMNAINETLALDLETAVRDANRDDEVHVIILEGSGKGFCAGFDLKEFAEGDSPWNQDMPWDPIIDYRYMRRYSECFQSLFKSHKPTIAKVHGHAVAGGSEIALSCDLTIMSEDAMIGYPPARVWGCPVSGMWVHRLGKCEIVVKSRC